MPVNKLQGPVHQNTLQSLSGGGTNSSSQIVAGPKDSQQRSVVGNSSGAIGGISTESPRFI